MVPDTPFPYDISTARFVGHQFDDAFAPEFTVFEQFGVASGFHRGDGIDALPCDGEDGTRVGQGKIVVQTPG